MLVIGVNGNQPQTVRVDEADEWHARAAYIWDGDGLTELLDPSEWADSTAVVVATKSGNGPSLADLIAGR